MNIRLIAIGALALLACGYIAEAQPSPATPPRLSSSDDGGRALARRWSTAWNAHDAKALGLLFAPDAVYEDLAFQARFNGRAGIAAWVGITATAIPDASIEILDAFGAKDRLTIRWRFRGTPKSLGAVPGTGRSFDVPAVTVLDLREGMIVREQDFYNLADLQRQIGVPAGSFTPQ